MNVLLGIRRPGRFYVGTRGAHFGEDLVAIENYGDGIIPHNTFETEN
jgi:hypothetical protein